MRPAPPTTTRPAARRALAATAALAAALSLAALPASAATWLVSDGSEVVFTSRAPMESFDGKTDQVRGHIGCDPTRLIGPCDLRIVVDLASLDTGIGLRNSHMRDRHLETDTYPEAVFTASEVASASAPSLAAGTPVEVVVRGAFDLHGVAREREITATVTLAPDGGLAVEAAFPVKLSDHGIDRPSFLVMKLADEQQVRVALSCRPEGS